jgi:hypothetical protein
MSVQAVLSRVQLIITAQAQLSGTPVAAGSAAAGANSASGASTLYAKGPSQTASFADALVAAQTTSAPTASSPALAQPSSAQSASSPALAQPSSAQSASSPASAAAHPAGVEVPQASWNPERKPVAAWIVPILQWASQHGWNGTVTSGYRSYEQQAAINASGAYSAPAGRSNHETAQYPGGAVDVTNPAQLLSALKGYTGPHRLVGGVLGAVDPEHFSANGR